MCRSLPNPKRITVAGSIISHPTNTSVLYFVHPTNLTERSEGALYRSTSAGRDWSEPLTIPGSGSGSQFAYSSLSFLPAKSGHGGARDPERLGLTFETWAEGCRPFSPACAIDFVTVPTAW